VVKMRDTLRNRDILEKLKSLQNDIINEQFDIKDFIVELGGEGLKVRELYQEFSSLSDEFEIITSLIDTREGF
tara:strand:+ start:758 stop:976 length:219 start_codon:yes stop_codon:yes gene_type:complete